MPLEVLRHDLYCTKHSSLALNVLIMWRSLGWVVRMKGRRAAILVHAILYRSLLRSGLIGLVALLAPPAAVGSWTRVPAPQAPVLVERFSHPGIDHAMWTPSVVGIGPKLAVKHGRLEETISADSAPPPSEGIFGAALTSRCTAAADLDAQVDYSLLTWPTSSGARIGLRLIPSGGGLDPGGQVERTSFAPSEYDGPQKEVYLTDFGSQIEGSTTTDDLSGKLRIVRTGDTMTGYYWHDGQWTLIHSGPGPTGAVAFGLDVWGFPTSFDHQTAKIAFGNFMVTQGQLDCTQIFAKRIHGSFGFSPRQAKVHVGTSVIWENDTRTIQTITSDTRDWKFDKKLRRGRRLSFVFTSPGTYEYHSKVHPSMKGRVVVSGEPPGQK